MAFSSLFNGRQSICKYYMAIMNFKNHVKKKTTVSARRSVRPFASASSSGVVGAADAGRGVEAVQSRRGVVQGSSAAWKWTSEIAFIAAISGPLFLAGTYVNSHLRVVDGGRGRDAVAHLFRTWRC